jgi:hypothetical protein
MVVQWQLAAHAGLQSWLRPLPAIPAACMCHSSVVGVHWRK